MTYYRRVNEIVHVPFLVVFSIALAVAFTHVSNKGEDFGESDGSDQTTSSNWVWGYGEGKDMVVRVNCTSYRHVMYDTVVEFGHGSGGGIAFRTRDSEQPRWVWEDGSVEFQDKLACDDLASSLKKSTKRGIPKYRFFNRYNKVFWIASMKDGVITFRNALNPVSIQLHVSDGFPKPSPSLPLPPLFPLFSSLIRSPFPASLPHVYAALPPSVFLPLPSPSLPS
ncbi:hypothetical protein GUITHDRAFT_155553 [Guillardia theta CCMP2712]|uniref:Uncharacterized protein n=1 Tax=Guillardia theta (strain CCMP2712) TaxID=905079 RepID=L1IH56_GUITC|nr:hypothetical protein GUITHDRAFT_155553 [Guillardia theta CCMP2712]EKX35249.1 hypothetical protein GUITHDRAFT_155553 [Guillardia theta CCMP2712]|eukprot:XP_005822229.1 hypothetical protein GUITHDRAFT_155553 [Guillardia theta CCMP2712]